MRARTLLARAIALAAALLAGGPALSAERLPLPPLGAVERGEYVARDARSGTDLWRAGWRLTKEGNPGRPVVLLAEDGRRLGDSVVPPTWSVRMRLDLWGDEPRLSSVRQAHDAAGRAAQTEQREFDYRAGSGKIVTTDIATGQAETQQVRITSQSLTPELLPAALRLLAAAPDRDMRFELVTRGGYVVTMQARVLGREAVEVPAGRFECFKVELDPTGFMGFLADLMLPRLFMWQTAAAPHFWVKYQGPEAGIGSRTIVRELLSFETESR